MAYIIWKNCRTFKSKNCLIDTHTAVALFATERYASESKAENAVVTVSTASPYKFASDVYTALTGNRVDSLEALDVLEEHTGAPAPTPLKNLKNRDIKHSRTIHKNEMIKAVYDFSDN